MNGWTFLDAPPARFRNEFREQAECAAPEKSEPTWDEVRIALWDAFQDSPDGIRRIRDVLVRIAEAHAKGPPGGTGR